MHIATEQLQGLCRFKRRYKRSRFVNLVQQGLSISTSWLPLYKVSTTDACAITHWHHSHKHSLTFAKSRIQKKIHNTSYGRQHVGLASYLHYSSTQAKQLGSL